MLSPSMIRPDMIQINIIYLSLLVLNPLGPNYTWRGSAGTTVAEGGRYYGKGMRIDYALVSRSILSLVVSTVILGESCTRGV